MCFVVCLVPRNVDSFSVYTLVFLIFCCRYHVVHFHIHYIYIIYTKAVFFY